MNYSEMTLRYFHEAPAAGTLPGAGVGRGSAGSRDQGTWVQFDVRLEAGHIVAARFLAFGCPHTVAAAARVAEQAVGRGICAELPEPVQMLQRLFEVPVEKLGRLLLVEDAWRAAMQVAADPAIVKNAN